MRVLGLVPGVPTGMYDMSDPYLPWRGKPGQTVRDRAASKEFDVEIRYNSLGFRGDEFAIQKEPDVFRIVALGDSFTLGSGAEYDQTYIYRLEENLNETETRDRRYEVYNFGVSRFWPEPQRTALEHHGLKYSPDLVTVGFVNNDIADTINGLSNLTVSKGYLVSRKMSNKFFVQAAIYSNLVRYILMRTGSSKTLNEPVDPESIDKAWTEVFSEYKKMQELSASVGAKFAVIYIPRDPPWGERAKEEVRRLSEFCSQEGCHFINTLPAFSAVPSPESLFYPQDGHCRPEGYRLIGDVVFKELRMKGLLK